jgi:carnitine-CoA ligase
MNSVDVSDVRDRIIVDILRRQAEAIGDELFLLDDRGTALTYSQVDELADRYATALARLGVSKGDVVALFMESSAEQVIVTLGVNRLGAIWSPANTDYRGEWLQTTFNDMRARVLVVDCKRTRVNFLRARRCPR